MAFFRKILVFVLFIFILPFFFVNAADHEFEAPQSPFPSSGMPKGLGASPFLQGDLQRIEFFLSDSQAMANWMDPETRILLKLGDDITPVFNASAINLELFESIRQARRELLTLIDINTSERAKMKFDLMSKDSQSQRFVPRPTAIYQQRNPITPSIGGEPLFNVSAPPSDRNTLFQKVTKELKTPRSIITPIVNKLNTSAETIEYLYEALDAVNKADARAKNMLITFLREGTASPAQIELAEFLGMLTKQQAMAIRTFIADLTRKKLLRPRPIGTTKPTTILTLQDVSSAHVTPDPNTLFSQPASKPPIKGKKPRRVLGGYTRPTILPQNYNNLFNDPFHDPFQNPYGWGTKFYKQPETGLPIPVMPKSDTPLQAINPNIISVNPEAAKILSIIKGAKNLAGVAGFVTTAYDLAVVSNTEYATIKYMEAIKRCETLKTLSVWSAFWGRVKQAGVTIGVNIGLDDIAQMLSDGITKGDFSEDVKKEIQNGITDIKKNCPDILDELKTDQKFIDGLTNIGVRIRELNPLVLEMGQAQEKLQKSPEPSRWNQPFPFPL